MNLVKYEVVRAEGVKTGMSDLFNTDLVNFLVKAYKMPEHVCLEVFEKTSSFEERNNQLGVMCLIYYLNEFEGRKPDRDKSSGAVPIDISAHWDGFLATAVMLTFHAGKGAT